MKPEDIHPTMTPVCITIEGFGIEIRIDVDHPDKLPGAFVEARRQAARHAPGLLAAIPPLDDSMPSPDPEEEAAALSARFRQTPWFEDFRAEQMRLAEEAAHVRALIGPDDDEDEDAYEEDDPAEWDRIGPLRFEDIPEAMAQQILAHEAGSRVGLEGLKGDDSQAHDEESDVAESRVALAVEPAVTSPAGSPHRVASRPRPTLSGHTPSRSEQAVAMAEAPPSTRVH